MKKLKMLGSGCIEKLDKEIRAQQIRRTLLMDTLHKEYGIPWAQIWNKCEALLEDMLNLKQKFDKPRLSSGSNTILVYSTAQAEYQR